MRLIHMKRSRVSLAYIFGGVFLGLSVALRLGLLFRAGKFLEGGPMTILQSLAVGLLFDLITLSYAGIPYLAFLVMAPQRLYSSRRATPFLQLAALGSLYVLIFVAVAEWFFFEEFGARFNFIAVDYLIYTQEVLGNIWESYPLTPILAGILLMSLALWLPLRKVILRSQTAQDTFGSRVVLSAPWALSALFFGFIADIQWSHVSTNTYLNEIASNGIYNFFSAFRANEIDYATFYPNLDEEAALARLKNAVAEPGSSFLSDDPWDLRREIRNGGKQGERKPNVALIVVESLSAEYTGALGSKKSLTPHLDRLALESLIFTNFYATGTRTDRGLESITLSVPPTPGRSLVKRPHNEGMFSLGRVLGEQGYEVKFIYGGYGYFDNMNHFFGHNGFQIVDRSDFRSEEITFSNAWGVCDEDLFRKSILEMRGSHQRGKPFLALILTTSNHRPYTYPEGRVRIPSGKGRAGAVLYTDWAIGHFLEEARKEPWFQDTIFLIVADHCANSAGKAALPVHRYRIPLFIYAPGLVRPGKVQVLGSQMDLAPTLLGLLGVDYTSKFLGRDLLRMRPEEGRAFMATYQKLGYCKGKSLVILDVRRPPAQYFWSPGARDLAPVTLDQSLVEEAIAYYQGAYLLHRKGLDRWEDGGEAHAQGRAH